MKKKKAWLKRVEIHYFCPVKERDVQYTPHEWQFSARSADCGMCGSHGSISVDFKCRACGENHDFTINSW